MTRFAALITWGLDLQTGKLIRAEQAQRRPGKGRYRCLDERCGRDLTVARSKHGRQHFRHFRNAHAESCVFYSAGGAQTRHSAAQLLLKTLFTEALKLRTAMPLLLFNTPAGPQTVLPFIVAATAETEWTCPQTGRRADVALLDAAGQPVLLIEVWHTHAVDADKERDFAAYFWIEVEANQVLSAQNVLHVRNHGNLPEMLALAWKQYELFGVVQSAGSG